MGEIIQTKQEVVTWSEEPVRNTVEEAMAILKPMFAQYAHTPVEPETIACYVDMLRDIPPATLSTAVRQCRKECTFLPSVAEIRQHADGLRRPATASLDLSDRRELSGMHLYRETKEQRLERIRRIEQRERVYGH